jgi:hypothetical protein
MSTTTIDSIFRPEELRAARSEAVDELVEELRVFARKAGNPAKRVALSELEQFIRDTRKSWEQSGLVNPQTSEAA